MNNSRKLTDLFALLIFACILFIQSCISYKSHSNFELSGSLSDGGAGMSIYLDMLLPDSARVIDSSMIDGSGNFAFYTGGVKKGFYNLRITNQNYITLILDSNENVKITGDAQSLGNTYNVTGSEDSKLFWVFNTFSKNNFYSRDSLTHLFNNLINSYKGSAERMDSLQNAFEKPYNTLVHEQNTFVKNFVSSHPKSFSSLAAVQQLSPDSQVHWYIKLDSALSKNYPKSVYIKHFHTKTESMKRVAIGAIAPDITLQDTNGYELSLNKMEEHNYLFIDFWASWCPACIESMPGLVKVYNTFRDKNFTIVGVSLDSKKDNWTSAIRKYHLIWTQVSDLKSWDSKVVALYNLSELPYSVLVSPKGKIIAKNIDPEQLNQMLDTLSLQSIINKPL